VQDRLDVFTWKFSPSVVGQPQSFIDVASTMLKLEHVVRSNLKD